METLIGKEEALPRAAQILKSGGVVAVPTETVYGLAADAFNEEAVAKIFEAKGRPQDNPLIVHIADPADAEKVAAYVPGIAYTLWEAFAPGPLTLVLKKRPELPERTTGGLQTVGIRIPKHPFARELARLSGSPFAAPSANVSGRLSPTDALAVYEDMKGKIPLILDGGPCEVGIESTVLDLTKEVPTILRPGAVTAAMLAPYLGKVINHKGEVLIAEAPGMKYRHYAPTVPCVSAKTPESACAYYDKLSGAVIIGRTEFVCRCAPRKVVSLGVTPEECMRKAFGALRKAEKIYSAIILEDFGEDENFFALENRLKKSSGGIVV